MNRLIAFTGPAHSGKTTAANLLCEKFGYNRISFARPLRDMLLAIGLTEEELSGGKEEPSKLLYGTTPRRAMQSLGDWGRSLDENFWLGLFTRKMLHGPAGARWVCDDCRYDNEAAAIRAFGGVVVRVDRPGLDFRTEHSSEHGISPHFVAATVRNDSTKALFEQSVFNLVPNL
jgi:hypothetical protein